MLAISPTDGKIKWGFQYTPQDPYDYDEISEHPIIDTKVNGEDRKLVVHAARNGFFYALDRTNGSFVAGKQYIDELNWATGPRPQDRQAAQLRPELRHPALLARQPRHARAAVGSHLPVQFGGKNWEPSAYNPELGLLFIPSIEGCNTIETIEQKDLADQGGTAKPRERFTGGSTKTVQRLYGSLKAVDPTTGETKAVAEDQLSELLRRAGDRRQPGVPRPLRRRLHAYDAKTLRKCGASTSAPASTPRRSLLR